MAPVDDIDDLDRGGASADGADADDRTLPDGWVDLMEGKIRKRTAVKGSGPYPEMKQAVRCSYEVRLAEDESAGLLQHRRDVWYRIGEAEAIPMLELGLRNMQRGEEAEICGVANMAWGPLGCKAAAEGEKDVPPNADIRMRVVLHELLEMHDGEMPWNSKIQEVAWRKANGNDHFRRQNFQKAARSYAAGLEVFQHSFEPPHELEHKAAAAAMAASMAADCGANLAAAHLELGDLTAARDAADAVLQLKPDHAKALYRKAKACLALDEFGPCEEALQRLVELEPSDAAAKRLQAELRRKRQLYQSRSRRVAERFFAGLQYPDRPDRPAEAAEEQPGRWQAVAEAAATLKTNVLDLTCWHWLAVAVCFLALAAVIAMQPRERQLHWIIGSTLLIPGPLLAVLTTDWKGEVTQREKKQA